MQRIALQFLHRESISLVLGNSCFPSLAAYTKIELHVLKNGALESEALGVSEAKLLRVPGTPESDAF
jgi:hypothetical protein